VDEADAGFISLDNSLSELTVGLNLQEAAFYRGLTDFLKQKRFWVAGWQFATSGLRSSSEVEALGIASLDGPPVTVFQDPTRTFHQLLFCQHARLESSYCGIDRVFCSWLRR